MGSTISLKPAFFAWRHQEVSSPQNQWSATSCRGQAVRSEVCPQIRFRQRAEGVRPEFFAHLVTHQQTREAGRFDSLRSCSFGGSVASQKRGDSHVFQVYSVLTPKISGRRYPVLPFANPAPACNSIDVRMVVEVSQQAGELIRQKHVIGIEPKNVLRSVPGSLCRFDDIRHNRHARVIHVGRIPEIPLHDVAFVPEARFPKQRSVPAKEK